MLIQYYKTDNAKVNEAIDIMNHNMKITNRSSIKILFDILKNPLYTENFKTNLEKYYQKNNKIKFICYKWFLKLRRKLSTSCNEEDLYNNKITEKSKNVYIIYKKSCKWLFDLNQLSDIIDKSICYSDSIYPDPKLPKNPYTNKNLTSLELIQIYKQLKLENKQSIYFDLFHKYSFDINEYLYYCYNILKEYSIKNYIKQLTYDDEEIYDYMEELLEYSSNYTLNDKNICILCLKNELKSNNKLLDFIKSILIEYNIASIKSNNKKIRKIANKLIYKFENDYKLLNHNHIKYDSLDQIPISELVFEIGKN